MTRTFAKVVLPLLVVVVAVLGAWGLAASRKAPERVERATPGPLVEVEEVAARDVPVTVVGNGEVQAKLEVDVVPQVAGRVVEVDPALVAGGRFRAGQTLLVIEPRDYELAVERARAAVERAGVALERERAEAAVARQEWEALHPGEAPDSGLVVREPQVRQAEAELAAAQADLDVAQLNLERTRVSVPFDGVVRSKSVGLGQFVAAGSRVARVYGTDVVEVRVPLEDRELAWFEVPRHGGGAGPAADVVADFGGAEWHWDGRVRRLEAQVDPESRMVHVVVDVRRPFDGPAGKPPLLPGTFVEVRIAGVTLPDVVEVPRHAIHHDDTVWVVEDGRLLLRPVEVARSDRDTSLVSAGLEPGEQVVVSALDAVTDGMKVRTSATGASPPEAPATAEVPDDDVATPGGAA